MKKWIIGAVLVVIGLGCGGAREELVEMPEELLLGSGDLSAIPGTVQPTVADLPTASFPEGLSEVLPAVEEPVSPIVQLQVEFYLEQAQRAFKEDDLTTAETLLDQALQLNPGSEAALALRDRLQQVQIKNLLGEAKGALKQEEFATAATLVDQALALDPESRAAQGLRDKILKAQARAEEDALKKLITLYQREGLIILKEGDTDRALVYFQAAQALDPTNQKTFKLIQRAHDTQHKLIAEQRERVFQAQLRQAKTEQRAAAETQLAALTGFLPEDDVTGTAAVMPTAGVEPAFEFSESVVTKFPEAPAGFPPAATTVTQEALLVQAPDAVEQPESLTPEEPYEYTVQPEDVLQITVYEEPELETRARVSTSGEIPFPLLGRVMVKGLTVPAVQEKLTTLLAKDYLVNPQVNVFIEVYHPRNIFVTGSVNKPGSYPIPTEQPTTVMEAITMAGGFSREAAPNGTKVIRIEDGTEKTIAVRVNDIIKKGDKNKDVAVQPNDIIFVPESFF